MSSNDEPMTLELLDEMIRLLKLAMGTRERFRIIALQSWIDHTMASLSGYRFEIKGGQFDPKFVLPEGQAAIYAGIPVFAVDHVPDNRPFMVQKMTSDPNVPIDFGLRLYRTK